MTRRPSDPDPSSLDSDIQLIISGAQADGESFQARHRLFLDRVAVPCDGFVIGDPVSVVEFIYDGNPRRGLTARCRRQDETTHVVAACDVVLPPRGVGGRCLAAYRRWLGLEPILSQSPEDVLPYRQHKVTAGELDLASPVELVLLSVKDTTARCQVLATRRAITLRASGLWDAVPGEIIVVMPHKQWGYAGHPYLSGEIQSTRLDVAALDLVPLDKAFDGLLPWGFVDNRPFLRCLHGFGLCCWRLGRFEEAERVFRRMLWLNPSDNQGARFLIDGVRAKDPWEDR